MGECVGGDTDAFRNDAPWCAGVCGDGEVCCRHAEVLRGAGGVGAVAVDVAGMHGRVSEGRWCALQDDGGRIDRRRESAGVGGVIAQVRGRGVLEQVVSKRTGGDGAPEFGGEQECERAIGACELQAALGERDGDIGLYSECDLSCGMSGDDGETAAEIGARGGVEVL